MAMILMFFHPDGIVSYTCTPWEQSAHPESRHFMDQGERLYSRREMKPTWWNKSELLPNVESTRQLSIPISACSSQPGNPPTRFATRELARASRSHVGQKVLFIVGDFVEDYEIMVPIRCC